MMLLSILIIEKEQRGNESNMKYTKIIQRSGEREEFYVWRRWWGFQRRKA